MVTDDPDRENEGDFICAAEHATTENINSLVITLFFGGVVHISFSIYFPTISVSTLTRSPSLRS